MNIYCDVDKAGRTNVLFHLERNHESSPVIETAEIYFPRSVALRELGRSIVFLLIPMGDKHSLSNVVDPLELACSEFLSGSERQCQCNASSPLHERLFLITENCKYILCE